MKQLREKFEQSRITEEIEVLEGEVMLAGFYKTSIEHIKPRLLELYRKRDLLSK